MQIHVVQPGESLFGIAEAYDVTVAEMIAANRPPDPAQLVSGQALVIPIVGRYHWVQPGESLWAIGQRYGVSPEVLAQVNRFPDPLVIQPGLRIYIPPRPRPAAEANAYIEPKGEEIEEQQVAQVSPYLTYVTMFSYEANRDGTVTPLDDQAAIAGARTGGAAPLMALTNLEEGAFSAELGQAILADEALQERLLDSVLEIMREKGFKGLNVDFEFLRPVDREPYNEFLRRAARRLREAGFTLSTALAPKYGPEQVGEWYEAKDYPAHGEITDFTVIMTYEWGWSGGPPRAVAPLNEVEKVLQYAVSVIPPEKVMMGIPLYGYDWTLPFVEGGPFARVVSPQAAVALAAQYGVPIQYDSTSQSPFFFYTDAEGKEHEVWFEDARSIQAKFNLVKRLGIRGVSYWRLPLAFPQNWLLLADNFAIRKPELGG